MPEYKSKETLFHIIHNKLGQEAPHMLWSHTYTHHTCSGPTHTCTTHALVTHIHTPHMLWSHIHTHHTCSGHTYTHTTHALVTHTLHMLWSHTHTSHMFWSHRYTYTYSTNNCTNCEVMTFAKYTCALHHTKAEVTSFEIKAQVSFPPPPLPHANSRTYRSTPSATESGVDVP